MKTRTILAAFTVFVVALAPPAMAEFTQAKGELTHFNGVPVPAMRTAAQARADAEKRIAAIKVEEAKVASTTTDTRPQDVFYTGKPYVEETGQYVFLFRHYDPELGRWTTTDPSGFPDGANNFVYVPDPTTSIDPDGFARVKIAEWYGLTYQETLSFSGLAIAAGAAAWASDVDPITAGLSGAAAAFGIKLSDFYATVYSLYPVGAQTVVGNLYSTDYQDIDNPQLVSGPHPEILSVSFSYSATATAFVFSALVDSSQHWIYE